MSEKTTLLFEHLGPGHFITFLREVAEIYRGAGDRVVCVLNGAFKGESCAKPMVDLPEGVELRWTEPFAVTADPLPSGAAAVVELAHAVREVGPDRVCLPTGDHAMLSLGVNKRSRRTLLEMPPLSMIVHNTKLPCKPSGAKDAAKIALHAIAARRAARHRLLTVDPFTAYGSGAARVRRRTLGGASFDHVPWLMDRHECGGTQDEARAKFDLPRDAKILVAVGAMNNYKRKGYDSLIASAPHWLGADGRMVVFAGARAEKALGPELAKLPEQIRGRVRLIDEYLQDQDFSAIMKASDAVWSANPNWRGMSSVQFLASVNGKPAVVAQSHESGAWLANRVGPAVAAPLDSPEGTADAVLRAMDMPGPTAEQTELLAVLSSRKGAEKVLAGEWAYPLPENLQKLIA